MARPRFRPLTPGRLALHLLLGVMAAVVCVLLIPLAGGSVNLRSALSAGPSAMSENPDALIFWGTRVPRVLLGLLVGGSLAVAGLVFQAVLRNPLADPYILGISGGAALGKAVAVVLALGGATIFFKLAPVACFAGAILPLIILYSLSARTRRFSPVGILLGGVILNVFFSALILLLQYFADFAQVRQMFLWSMGGLDVTGYKPVVLVIPVALLSFGVIVSRSRAMNLLSLDEGTAAHLGIDVKRSINVLVWAAAVLTSAVVAASGPIGFVGLIVPHSLRLIYGPDNRLLVPLSAVWGGVFLAVCDFVGWRGLEMCQAIGIPLAQTTEIPVGVITALLGGPFFLFLLMRRGEGASLRG